MKYFIFTKPPLNFSPDIEVAANYCECEGRLLFLKRHPLKPEGHSWGVPAGKLNKDETPEEAAVRELFEETGIASDEIASGGSYLGALYFSHPHLRFVFHLFKSSFAKRPKINLNLLENIEALWLTAEEARAFPLISGGLEALNYYAWKKEHPQGALRHSTRHGAYGVLIKDGSILLVEKKKGLYANLFDLPGGGIDEGETSEQALIREMKEEVGLSISSFEPLGNLFSKEDDLHVADIHQFHRFGHLFKVSSFSEIKEAHCEESFQWIPLHKIEKEKLTPFVNMALDMVK